MTDGAAAPRTGDPADDRARAADGRLIRGVRWRLVLFSGLTTMVVLAVLGIGLYVAAASTLESNGLHQLQTRLEPIVAQVENPRLRPSGPAYGFNFGGSSSGTYAIAVNAAETCRTGSATSGPTT